MKKIDEQFAREVFRQLEEFGVTEITIDGRRFYKPKTKKLPTTTGEDE